MRQLDLELAAKRVYRNVLREQFPNRLDAALLKHFPNDVVDRVGKLLSDSSMDWANGTAQYYDVPRGDGLVRPICYLDVDARVAYQALVDAVSREVEPYIDEKFGDRVLSHRVKSANSEVMYQDAGDAYSRFIEIQHNVARGSGYGYCVKLDIANYYERVYHHKLQQLLERRGVSGAVTSALCTLLRKFASGDSHGIPQGLWPSDYLGNMYLLYLDEHLAAADIYAVRYVDDYRIFCKTERDGKYVLKECCAVLRDIGLSPQPLKTRIVTVDKLDPELKPLTEQFLSLRTEKIKVIVRQLEVVSMGEEVVVGESEEWEQHEREAPLTDEDIRAFEKLWTEAVDQEDKRSSILRFALAGLSVGASPTAEQYLLEHLSEFPQLASVVSKYLSALGFKDQTANQLLSFAQSEDCVYEWQQLWLLEYFRSGEVNILPYKSGLKAIMRDGRRHPLVRALVAEILAAHGDDSDGEEIKRLFTNETHPRVRRSLLLGYRLLPVTERNYAISYLPPTEWNLRVVGQLVKSNADIS